MTFTALKRERYNLLEVQMNLSVLDTMKRLKFNYKICQTDNDLVELVKHEKKTIEEEETKQ